MGNSVSDIELYLRVRNNDDRRAFDALFRLYYAGACRFASAYLKSTEESEEIVSDIFFMLWTRRKEISITANVRAYLYTCVRNECFAVLERKKLSTEPITSQTIEISGTESSPIQKLEFDELNVRVNFAVDALPPQCRQIFMLSRFDGLKYKEIAEILTIAEKTVENQMIKALNILRDNLRQERAMLLRTS